MGFLKFLAGLEGPVSVQIEDRKEARCFQFTIEHHPGGRKRRAVVNVADAMIEDEQAAVAALARSVTQGT